jgi:hypothetical protein
MGISRASLAGTVQAGHFAADRLAHVFRYASLPSRNMRVIGQNLYHLNVFHNIPNNSPPSQASNSTSWLFLLTARIVERACCRHCLNEQRRPVNRRS